MNGKELKNLGRRELVDIIYQMKKNEQQLQEEIDALKAALEEKRLRLSKAGNVAEAAAAVTGVLSAAQTTADLYLQEITVMKAETEKECARKIEAANRKVADILAEGEKRYTNLNERYKKDYQKWTQLKEDMQTLEKSGNHEG